MTEQENIVGAALIGRYWDDVAKRSESGEVDFVQTRRGIANLLNSDSLLVDTMTVHYPTVVIISNSAPDALYSVIYAKAGRCFSGYEITRNSATKELAAKSITVPIFLNQISNETVYYRIDREQNKAK